MTTNIELKGCNEPLYSPLRWLGNKQRLIQKYELDKYFPRFQVRNPYCEIFGGSMAMFFKLMPNFAILNDINKELVNFWIVIDRKYSEFAFQIQYMFNGDDFLTYLDNKGDDVSRAVSFYIKNSRSCMDFGKCNYIRKDLGKWKEIMDKCRLRITNYDYKECIKRRSNTKENDAVFYADPPYIEENFYSKHGTDESMFKLDDHYKLAEIFNEISNPIFISYGDNKLVYDLYPKPKWNYLKFKWTSGQNIKRVDLFISNQKLQKRNSSSDLRKWIPNI